MRALAARSKIRLQENALIVYFFPFLFAIIDSARGLRRSIWVEGPGFSYSVRVGRSASLDVDLVEGYREDVSHQHLRLAVSNPS